MILNSLTPVFLVFWIVILSSTSEPESWWRFAFDFSTDSIMHDFTKTSKFIGLVMDYEGKFNQPGVGYDGESCHTYDGHGINYTTGKLTATPRPWSAPSKESLHIIMLTLSLQGDYPLAVRYMKAGDEKVDAMKRALQILTTKISTYEKFSTSYPGYGGFLPWVRVSNVGIFPDPPDSTTGLYKLPAQDNGQLMWALYMACHVLKDIGQETLKERYCQYFNKIVQNAKTLFYAGNGTVLGEVGIVDPNAPVSAYNTRPLPHPHYLRDPYEGELFTVILDLFANWSSDAERDELWTAKRESGMLAAVDYTTASGSRITVQKGWLYSSHELWKFLVLPYTEVDIARRVFVNGEKARTWYSNEESNPGLLASVTVPTTGSIDTIHESACGIQELAWATVQRTDIVTPYASFPVILANQAVGLAWYHNMLMGPKMQGPYGSTVSCNVHGTMIAPLLTWDAKQTTVVALLGGTGDLIKKYLPRDSLERFKFVVDRQYSAVFTELLGEHLDYMLPSATIPQGNLEDFTSSTTGTNGANKWQTEVHFLITSLVFWLLFLTI